MKSITPVQLLHNPGAGEQDHSRDHIVSLLSEEGWDCRYFSSKEEFTIEKDVKLFIVAGGDGTVRKAAEKMVKMEHPPLLAVLPMGTANNIANTLGFGDDNIDDIIRSWTSPEVKVQVVDTGWLKNGKTEYFFLEGVGMGLFPDLIIKMQKEEKRKELTGKESLSFALQKLYELSRNPSGHYCELMVDGQTWSGDYSMIEILNMKRIGPGLELAPSADLNDGLLDIMLLPEKDSRNMETYLQNKINAGRDVFSFPVIRGKEIEVKWQGEHIHIDDQLIDIKKGAVLNISIKKDSLSFISKK